MFANPEKAKRLLGKITENLGKKSVDIQIIMVEDAPHLEMMGVYHMATQGKQDIFGTLNEIKKTRERKRLTHPTQGTLFETWPEIYPSQAICSHALVRGALFSCRRPNSARETYVNRFVSTTSQYEIFQTGPELRQDDANVLLYLIQAAAEQQTFSPRIVTYRALSKLKLAGTGEDYARFLESLDRLYATSLEIKMLGAGTVGQLDRPEIGGFKGHLLSSQAWVESGATSAKTEWVIQLEPRLAQLFPTNGWSYVRWEHRNLLRRKPLASWLHWFLASSQKPIPLSISTYHRLSDSDNKILRYFKSALLRACNELVTIGFLTTYHVTPNDLLVVERAQAKPLLNN